MDNKKEENKKSRKGNLVLGVIVAATLCLVGLTAFTFWHANQKAESEAETSTTDTTVVETYDDYTKVKYNGETYKYNTDIKTILFLGNDEKDVDDTEGGEAGRSDTMILLIVNSAEESVTMLSVSRDTIAEVAIVNEYGERVLSAEMHLALQYSYGDGGDRSCQLSRDAVSQLLYGIPINYYISMNLDGLNSVVDAIGGLTLTMDDDYTYIDEAFVEGATIEMDGEQVETFVRYRDITVLGSNDVRMARQEIFLQAFVSQLKEKISGNSTSVEVLWTLISPFLTTDVSVDMMESLVSYEFNEETYKVPGQTVEGEEHDEYIVDQESLQEILIKLLYKLS